MYVIKLHWSYEHTWRRQVYYSTFLTRSYIFVYFAVVTQLQLRLKSMNTVTLFPSVLDHCSFHCFKCLVVLSGLFHLLSVKLYQTCVISANTIAKLRVPCYPNKIVTVIVQFIRVVWRNMKCQWWKREVSSAYYIVAIDIFGAIPSRRWKIL